MRLGSVMIGSADVKRLGDYYTALFGAPRWDDGSGFLAWELGAGSGFAIGPHDGVAGRNAHPGRVMWNVETLDFQADYDRLAAAGGIVVREPYDPMGEDGGEGSGVRIATFEDPDGNYFQLTTPMTPPE
jgi:catechol 2,3-dioxygenase-like lactoylglutathione lyase family enzyme